MPTENRQDDRERTRARRLAIAVTLVCLIAIPAALMVAGFAIYVFDWPGGGALNTILQWAYFVFAWCLPAALVALPVLAWRGFARGSYARVRRAGVGLLIVLALLVVPAWMTFFS